MKYLFGLIFAFIAFLVFAPVAGSTEIRNPELLIALIALGAILLVIRILKFAILTGKLKKILKNNKYQLKRMRLGFGKLYITAENHKETLEICLLRRKKDYLKHHFAGERHIELYKATVSAVRTGRDIAKVSKYSEVKHVNDIYISPSRLNEKKCFIIFDVFPSLISDYTNRSLQIGDKIGNSEIRVFDMKTFANF